MRSDASLDPERRYRWWLLREWDASLPRLVVIGLNPSTADEREDDPTIRRCIAFAKRWGYGSLTMLNLFAFRSTDPDGLYSIVDPIGWLNDQTLTEQTRGAPMVLCAWGAGGAILDRGPKVIKSLLGLGRPLCSLGVTKDGHPKHPLYLRSDLIPEALVA
jgi:hypothetical protein